MLAVIAAISLLQNLFGKRGREAPFNAGWKGL
jgi:hypothetical protein